MTTLLETQLHAARQRLLDLTMRNRLLNYRATKRKTIALLHITPDEVYQSLVLRERALPFAASASVAPEAASVPPLPTALAPEELDRRLLYMAQHASTVFEEQGYTVLYLALGFLGWTESTQKSAPLRMAPVLLLPVELQRPRLSAAWRLRWTGDELQSNLSLQAKLAEQGVTLPSVPSFEAPEALADYFQTVQSAISAFQAWHLTRDMTVDFFNFSKFVMYKDLQAAAWAETPETPLLRAILDPVAHPQSLASCPEEQLDEQLRVRDVYHIMDADPSQMAVIEEIKRGHNLVVEGPPGTGKSQTIANAIAELLAAGKRVLVVSEKMAALDVVKQRLDQAGLGNFCLALHSRRTPKRLFLKELERILATTSGPVPQVESRFDEVETLKTALNDYARALQQPFGTWQISPFALLSQWEKACQHFARRGRTLPQVSFPDLQHYGPPDVVAAMANLRDLAAALPLVQPLRKHPWWGCFLGTILPRDEDEIAALLQTNLRATHAFVSLLDELDRLCTFQRPETPAALPQTLLVARVMAASAPVDQQVLLHHGWNQPGADLEALIQDIARLHEHRNILRGRFKSTALDHDIATLLQAYSQGAMHWWQRWQRSGRHLKRTLSALYLEKPPRAPQEIVAHLTQLADYQALRQRVQHFAPLGQALFGSHWHGEDSDPERLRTFAGWMMAFRQQLVAEALAQRQSELHHGAQWREQVESTAAQVEAAWQQVVAQRDRLAQRLALDWHKVFGTPAENVAWGDWLAHLEAWQMARPALQRWGQYLALQQACQHSLAAPLLDVIAQDTLEPDDVLPCFAGNFAETLLRQAFQYCPALGHFVGELHEAKIRRFAELDRDVIAWNRQRLAVLLYQRRPRLAAGASPGSETGIVLGELSRRRGHIPIRQLLSRAGHLLQQIVPCFLMSPLSVAQFLEPHTMRFDVVIFDEASQVRPEDALGALLRSTQVVVFGDTRQLPPSSFFDHVVDAEDDDETDFGVSIADVESILHQCKRTLPTRMLRWCYRGRHESLMAVANQELYNDALLLYPSPLLHDPYFGLHLMYIPETRYDRGSTAVNRLEARAVAEAVVAHYRQTPEKSLGVGTFNIQQQQAILEEVEALWRQHPEIERLLARQHTEPFFVKNLETIQGDERDVMLISIGFGFDVYDRFSRHFGALNHEGGERRLNVLMTRARERCVVYSNFRASDLLLPANAPRGLQVLRTWLAYAEQRSQGGYPTQPFETPLLETVAAFLQAHGYTVQAQVGCGSFRVDLALHDPTLPGRYLLGILSDAPRYHTTPVARERDRLRQQMLTSLGWRLYALWAPDWYRDRHSSERKLLEAVEQAMMAPRLTPMGEATVLPSFPGAGETAPFTPDTTLMPHIPVYRVCTAISIPTTGELQDVPLHQLATAIIQIVEVEGPVHIEETVRRLRVLWQVKRASKKLMEVIDNAILIAERRRGIRRQGAFLWPAVERPVPVRRRSGDPPARLPLICDAEITAAMQLVLGSQHATLPAELISNTARLLGIRTVNQAVMAPLQALIERHLEEGFFQRLPNGMIYQEPS